MCYILQYFHKFLYYLFLLLLLILESFFLLIAFIYTGKVLDHSNFHDNKCSVILVAFMLLLRSLLGYKLNSYIVVIF